MKQIVKMQKKKKKIIKRRSENNNNITRQKNILNKVKIYKNVWNESFFFSVCLNDERPKATHTTNFIRTEDIEVEKKNVINVLYFIFIIIFLYILFLLHC